MIKMFKKSYESTAAAVLNYALDKFGQEHEINMLNHLWYVFI